jgi:hypothetical protein
MPGTSDESVDLSLTLMSHSEGFVQQVQNRMPFLKMQPISLIGLHRVFVFIENRNGSKIVTSKQNEEENDVLVNVCQGKN